MSGGASIASSGLALSGKVVVGLLLGACLTESGDPAAPFLAIDAHPRGTCCVVSVVVTFLAVLLVALFVVVLPDVSSFSLGGVVGGDTPNKLDACCCASKLLLKDGTSRASIFDSITADPPSGGVD